VSHGLAKSKPGARGRRGRASECCCWQVRQPAESSRASRLLQELLCGERPMSGRGLAAKSKALIELSRSILEQIQPATVRGVCYQLFTRGAIGCMRTAETQKVSRLLVYAREQGIIPWDWIVDETREPERVAAWRDVSDYGQTVVKSYRKNFWQQQPERVEIWSEKGTVRGVLAPVLEEFAVTFSVKHGFDSATSVNGVAEQTAGSERPLLAFYVGDWDPSGLCMSERDLPQRLERYGANVDLRRIALTRHDIELGELPSFPVATKIRDPRYRWFVENYGHQCWELDALPAPMLRERVREAIISIIDIEAWNHCAKVERAELESIRKFDWKGLFSYQSQNTRESS
jgi:hypothetical protein